MVIKNKYRIFLYSIFFAGYLFMILASLVASSARSGLLDSYFFISASPHNLRSYEKADYHTALALWAYSGFKLPYLNINEIYALAYEDKQRDRKKFLINPKFVCISNDTTCKKNYLRKKALDNQKYKKFLLSFIDKNSRWCTGKISICDFLESKLVSKKLLPSIAPRGYLRTEYHPDFIAPSERNSDVVSYLPFGKYHFKNLKKGDVIYHKQYLTVAHTASIFSFQSKGKDFKNYSVMANSQKHRADITLHEDIEELDIVFLRSSYGYGFGYTSGYGPLNMAGKESLPPQ